jgi:hypothetical protein
MVAQARHIFPPPVYLSKGERGERRKKAPEHSYNGHIGFMLTRKGTYETVIYNSGLHQWIPLAVQSSLSSILWRENLGPRTTKVPDTDQPDAA